MRLINNQSKKAFTLIETLGVIVILAIVLGIVSVAFIYVNDNIKKTYYKGVEENLFTAGGEYFTYNKGSQPKVFGNVSKVSVSELVDSKYISEVVGRGSNTCNLNESYVGAYKDSYDKTNYYVCLKCDDYTSDSCNMEIGYSLRTKLTVKDTSEIYVQDTWAPGYVTLKFETLNDIQKVNVKKEDNTIPFTSCNLIEQNNYKTCKIEIDETGSYEVYGEGENGNITNKEKIEIKIDNTAPTFKVYDQDNSLITDNAITYKKEDDTISGKVSDILDTESGIKRIRYSFEKEGNSTNYKEISKDVLSFDFNKEVDFGKYVLLIEVVDNVGNITKREIVYTIYSELEKPNSGYCKNDLVYSGVSQILTKDPGVGFTFIDNYGLDAKVYDVIVRLSENYRWSDGTDNDVIINCEIAKSKTSKIGSCKDLIYNGSSQYLMNLDGNNVKYINNTAEGINAGVYTVEAIPGDSNHSFSDGTTSKTIDCTITQKIVTISAKDQTITFEETISKTTNDIISNGLLPGHSISNITLTESIVDGTIIPSNAVIKSGDTIVTSNYDITYNSGRLISETNICANFYINGAAKIGNSTTDLKLCCQPSNGSSSCSIQTPTITPISGFTAMGWTDDGEKLEEWNESSGVEGQYAVNTSVTLNKPIENSGEPEEFSDTVKNFYAITRSNTRNSYNVTYDINGATSYIIDGISYTETKTFVCNAGFAYNGALLPDSCSITLPKITRTGGTVYGWNYDLYNQGEPEFSQEEIYTLYEDTELFAITSRDINLSYNANSSNGTTSNKLTTQTKTAYNTDGVVFNIPNYTDASLYRAQSNSYHGYRLLGLAETNTASSVKYCFGDQIYLENDQTLHAVWQDIYASGTSKVGGGLNVRSCGSTSCGKIATIAYGDVVYIMGGYSCANSHPWYPIKYGNSVGYSSGAASCTSSLNNFSITSWPYANSSDYGYTCSSNNKLLSITPTDVVLNITDNTSKQKLSETLKISNQCGVMTSATSSNTNLVNATTGGVITAVSGSVPENETKTAKVTFSTRYGCSETINVTVKNTDAPPPTVNISVSGDSSTCSGAYIKGATATVTCDSEIAITNFSAKVGSTSNAYTQNGNKITSTIYLDSTGSKTITASCSNSEGTTTASKTVTVKVKSVSSSCTCKTRYSASSTCSVCNSWTTLTSVSSGSKHTSKPTTGCRVTSSGMMLKAYYFNCSLQDDGTYNCGLTQSKCTAYACKEYNSCCHT